MTSRSERFCLMAVALLAVLGVAAQAQQYDSFQLPPRTDSGGAGETWAEAPGPGPILPGVSGTPPTWTRQQQVQLRDGRTITHDQTRSWDGTPGTMERTFAGPNGQQRYSQRPWTPDDPSSSPPDAPPEKSKTWGWVEKLNPFRKGGPFRPSKPDSASPPHGSGFTIGSGQNRGVEHAPQGLTKKQPGEPSPSWRRPPWAGNPHASNFSTSPSRSSRGKK